MIRVLIRAVKNIVEGSKTWLFATNNHIYIFVDRGDSVTSRSREIKFNQRSMKEIDGKYFNDPIFSRKKREMNFVVIRFYSKMIMDEPREGDVNPRNRNSKVRANNDEAR